MKKQFCMFILFFLSLHSFSQQGNKIKFGIKLGAAFSKSNIEYTNGSSPPELTTKNSLMLGGFSNISINDNLVFQPSILYVPKGAREKIQNSYTSETRYPYLEIPLNILYRSKQKSGIYLLGGGLSPAFSLNNYQSQQTLKSFDLGINVLAAYMVPIGFSLNLGYTHGLLNVSKDKTYISNIQNRYFSITAGYEF